MSTQRHLFVSGLVILILTVTLVIKTKELQQTRRDLYVCVDRLTAPLTNEGM